MGGYKGEDFIPLGTPPTCSFSPVKNTHTSEPLDDCPAYIDGMSLSNWSNGDQQIGFSKINIFFAQWILTPRKNTSAYDLQFWAPDVGKFLFERKPATSGHRLSIAVILVWINTVVAFYWMKVASNITLAECEQVSHTTQNFSSWKKTIYLHDLLYPVGWSL